MRRLLSHVGRAGPGAAVVFDDWPLPPPAPPTLFATFWTVKTKPSAPPLRRLETRNEKAVLNDPERLRQFTSFVNAPDQADPSLAYVEQRGQRRPATPAERESGAVLIAPSTLEVRS